MKNLPPIKVVYGVTCIPRYSVDDDDITLGYIMTATTYLSYLTLPYLPNKGTTVAGT